jgi:hypothetical protein
MNAPVSRRQFFATVGAAAGTTVLAPTVWASKVPRPARKRIALIATEVRLHSHAQHFIDRLLLGYVWEGGWRKPEVDLVSLYE